MVDEHKNMSSDYEYQFPQDEYVTTGTESHAAPEAVADQGVVAASKSVRFKEIVDRLFGSVLFRNKRILGAIIATLVLIIVFRFFYSNTPVPVKPVVQEQQQPIEQPSNGGMLNSLDALKAHYSQARSQIATLQGQVTDMQSAIQQLQTSHQQLQQSIEFLNSQIKDLSTEMNKVLSAAKLKSSAPQVVYHLRAVLLDRAWITSKNGETKTITVGDKLTDYGTVRSIDPQTGIVMTSSGRKIEYGPNDR